MKGPFRALLVSASLSVTCAAPLGSFECSESAACVLAGQRGTCEPTGHCSFPDATCSGGRRYGDHAPAPLARACVKARACGDGVSDSGEECDDGNDRDDDGCTRGCVRCDSSVGGDARTVWPENGACFVRHDGKATWSAALARCSRDGGHLATMTAPEQAVVTTALLQKDQPLWMGLSDTALDGTFAWVTSEPVFNTRWRVMEPAEVMARADCGALDLQASESEARWTVRACVSELGFLCERPPWIVRSSDRHAYRVIQSPLPWAQARQACVTLGGHLATITSEEEHAFVLTHFFGSLWIGASDLDQEGTYAWVTGEPFTFDGWAANEPDNHQSTHNCVHLGEERRWHDFRCEVTKPFLCELD